MGMQKDNLVHLQHCQHHLRSTLINFNQSEAHSSGTGVQLPTRRCAAGARAESKVCEFFGTLRVRDSARHEQ